MYSMRYHVTRPKPFWSILSLSPQESSRWLRAMTNNRTIKNGYQYSPRRLQIMTQTRFYAEFTFTLSHAPPSAALLLHRTVSWWSPVCNITECHVGYCNLYLTPREADGPTEKAEMIAKYCLLQSVTCQKGRKCLHKLAIRKKLTLNPGFVQDRR